VRHHGAVNRPQRTLWHAAWSGDERPVAELLAGGADPDERFGGKIRSGVRAVELLVGSGADPAASAADGTTPPHIAAVHANCQAVRALVAAAVLDALGTA
jgi:ankyrin repeat protein